MTEHAVGTARGILRNSAAMFLVGVLAKGMGLIIAILIARFLGPTATGLFALLFGIAVVTETLTTLGVPDALLREIAAKPDTAAHLFRSAVKIVLAVSILPTVGFLIASLWFEPGDPARSSLLVLCVSTPIAALFTISQATLQGLERMLLLTWTIFAMRVLSLAWLAFALWQGANVESAFISRLMFQFGSIAVFVPLLWRRPGTPPAEPGVRSLLLRSFPFALNKIINDLNVRLPAIVLPAMLGLAKSGLFDAAERVRNTIAMSMQAAMLGMMPALSRNFSESGSKSGQLISYAAKYVAISMSLISTGIVVFAGWIIRLLYGDQFLDAILLLQFLAWAQTVLAVDAVLRQSMLASRNEYSAVRRSLAGLLIQAFVLIAMAKAGGLTGVAVGMLVAAIALLGVDVRFVHTRIAEIQIAKAVVAPLSAALVIGAVLLVIDPADIWTRILVASAGWALAVLALRLVPRDEALLLKKVLLKRRRIPPNKD